MSMRNICQIVHLWYALDIVVVLLMLWCMCWHFDSVLLGCFEHISSHGVCVNKEDGAK